MALQYAFLTQIRDRAIRDAVKLALDRITALEAQLTALGTVTAPLETNLDAAGHKLTALANPTADQDAVTLRYLKTYVESRLSAAGLIGPDGQAATPTDTDGGETARGVTDAGADGDIGTGETTAYRAGLIIGGVAHEYPALVAPVADEATLDANRLELLLRTIWHLNESGFSSGRQRNPSGLLSTDKIAVVESGVTRAFDTYTAGMAIQALQVFPANLVADPGTPD